MHNLGSIANMRTSDKRDRTEYPVVEGRKTHGRVRFIASLNNRKYRLTSLQ